MLLLLLSLLSCADPSTQIAGPFCDATQTCMLAVYENDFLDDRDECLAYMEDLLVDCDVASADPQSIKDFKSELHHAAAGDCSEVFAPHGSLSLGFSTILKDRGLCR